MKEIDKRFKEQEELIKIKEKKEIEKIIEKENEIDLDNKEMKWWNN